MFFSRSRPSVAMVAKAITETLGAQQKQALRTLPNSRAINGTANTPVLPLLSDLKEIPGGRYVAFVTFDIPILYMDRFAFLSLGETAGILLVAVDALSTHPQFEMKRRLEEKGIKNLRIQQATREIIKAIHSSNQTEKVVADTVIDEIAWGIIDDAVERNCSDIHIESHNTHARIFFRIHGERIEQANIAKDTAVEICNVLYNVHADADNKGIAWDMKTIQNTVIERMTSSGKHAQLRFSSGPMHPTGNFHAVMRVLNLDKSSIKPLDQIGYTVAQVAAINDMLAGGRGMVLLVGPTNSGKSTSMQSFIECIYIVRGRSIKVLTVEDPVEYIIPDAVQMGVPDGRKLSSDGADSSTFAEFLKGMLRQDPDVAMIGEIRDAEGAESLKNMVLTGRKVLTTLHVDEVLTVYARLRELGIPESVLFMGKFISGVVCQRLLPVLCSACSLPFADAMDGGRIRQATFDRVMRVIDLYSDNVRVRSQGGCACCGYTGIVGRTICAELLVPDATFLSLMSKGDLMGARQYWAESATALNVENFGVTMMAHAISKMRVGVLDPCDIEAYLDPIVVNVPDAASGRGVPLSTTDFPHSLQS